jgi:ankyrin repeat protein
VNETAAAARSGDIKAISRLRREGIDLNAPSGVNRWPPLHHAVHKNRSESIRALAAAGARVDERDPNGITALMMAAGYGYTEAAAALLNAGADAEMRDYRGKSARDYATTGVIDIDRFTLFRKQHGVLALLDKRAMAAAR